MGGGGGGVSLIEKQQFLNRYGSEPRGVQELPACLETPMEPEGWRCLGKSFFPEQALLLSIPNAAMKPCGWLRKKVSAINVTAQAYLCPWETGFLRTSDLLPLFCITPADAPMPPAHPSLVPSVTLPRGGIYRAQRSSIVSHPEKTTAVMEVGQRLVPQLRQGAKTLGRFLLHSLFSAIWKPRVYSGSPR